MFKTELLSLDVSRTQFSLAYHPKSNAIILTGGCDSFTCSPKAFKYEIDKDSWDWFRELKQPRQAHSSVITGDKIWVIQGRA